MTFLRLLTVGLWYFVKRNRWNFLVIFTMIYAEENIRKWNYKNRETQKMQWFNEISHII